MQYRVVTAEALSTQRQLLWDLCYRATGTSADADLLLHEAFAKAVERPHLVGPAATLAIDVLRHRRRRQYVGTWLPAPIETGNAVSPAPRSHTANGARYDMVESGSFAFLRALEALEPRERVVFVMCDAFGFPVQEAAATVDFTSATARMLLQNARRKMQRYDTSNVAPTAEAQAHVAALLRDCVTHLQSRDASRLEKVLALDGQAMFDSGGEFVAPSGVASGSNAAAKVLTKFAGGMGPINFSFRMLNGLPAALGQSNGRPRWARRLVLRVDARDGLISEVHVIMASAKLTAVRFDPL